MKTITLELTSQEAARVQLAIARDVSDRQWRVKHHQEYQADALSLLQNVNDRLGNYQDNLRDEYEAWANGEISQIAPESMTVGREARRTGD